MLDEMRPEQMMEWMAFMMVSNDANRPAAYTDPKDQLAILRNSMGL